MTVEANGPAEEFEEFNRRLLESPDGVVEDVDGPGIATCFLCGSENVYCEEREVTTDKGTEGQQSVCRICWHTGLTRECDQDTKFAGIAFIGNEILRELHDLQGQVKKLTERLGEDKDDGR